MGGVERQSGQIPVRLLLFPLQWRIVQRSHPRKRRLAPLLCILNSGVPSPAANREQNTDHVCGCDD